MNKNIRPEIAGIIFVSFVLAFSYNLLSDNGIPLIRKGVEIVWESDSVINQFIKSDTMKLPGDTAINTKIFGKFKTDTAKIAASEGISKETAKKNLAVVDTPKTAIIRDEIKPPVAEPTQPIVPTAITVDQAYKLFLNNAVFLDSRMEVEYNLGHIKGAICIPFKQFDKLFPKISHLDKDAVIICYCDGSGCDLSIDMAKKLSELGYRNVKIFYSGWNDWKEKNYPME